MSQSPASQPAIVIFVEHAECRWLRCLRPGFRHCFVALRDGSTWLVCDPLKDRLELSVLPVPADFDLAGFYAQQGHVVLHGLTRTGLPRGLTAIVPLTCVTVAKRLLGVRAPWVLTPWQLCRHLRGVVHGFVDVRPVWSPVDPALTTQSLTGDVNKNINLLSLAEHRPAAQPMTARAVEFSSSAAERC